MSKSENITYQAVAKICNEMTASGDAPSVRKLHARLGGSFSTITGHLNQWRSQQALAQSSDNELSAEFNQALMAEFARITEAVKEKSKLQIAEKEAQLAEAIELLSAHESKLEECEKKYREMEKQAKSEQLDLEKRLAAAISDSDSLKQRELVLQEKIDALIDKCHQAELRAAIAETKIEKKKGEK